MNVLLVDHVFPPEIAPAGVNAQELAEDLARQGQKVTVITGWPNHPKGVLFPGWKARWRHVEHDPRGYRVIRCGHSIHPRGRIAWRMWYYFTFAVSSFLNGLAAGPIDVIQIESTAIFGPLTCWLLAKCKGARLAYRIHDLHPETARNAGLLKEGIAYSAMRAIDTFVCRRCDVISTLSESMVQNILKRNIDPGKVTLIRHWVDADKIRPSQRDNPWRRQQQIPLDKFIALHAGTIGYISGAEVIIQAAQQLFHRREILFLFVGEGVLRPRLIELVEKLKLTNVRFLPFQPAEVLSDVQATADVSLVTLLPEAGESSIPSKVVGYIAAGRPVIGSLPDNAPTADLIRRGDMGIVVPCQDAPSLAEAVAQLAGDAAQAQRLGANARRFFLENFERKSCSAQVAAQLIGIVRRARTRPGVL